MHNHVCEVDQIGKQQSSHWRCQRPQGPIFTSQMKQKLAPRLSCKAGFVCLMACKTLLLDELGQLGILPQSISCLLACLQVFPGLPELCRGLHAHLSSTSQCESYTQMIEPICICSLQNLVSTTIESISTGPPTPETTWGAWSDTSLGPHLGILPSS